VLDPVLGYLLLAEHLVLRGSAAAQAWNFGPFASSEVPVATIVDHLVRLWGMAARWEKDGGDHPHEAACLKLDCTKAAAELGWRPLLQLEDALRLTVEWYQAFHKGSAMRAFMLAQIEQLMSRPLRHTQSYGRLAVG
jgi:CDP-glucose 4,6-dehydratase